MVNSWFILAENSKIFNHLKIAQLVERRTGNQEVPGSIPGQGNYLKKLEVSFLIEDKVGIRELRPK